MIKPKYHFFHRVSLALQGFFTAIKRERHMKIHLIISFLLLFPLIWIEINSIKIWILIILLALLIAMELMNTAIEITVDMVTKRFSYRAKLAKDISSAAVLIMALLVANYSIFIYSPSMYNFIKGVFIGH